VARKTINITQLLNRLKKANLADDLDDDKLGAISSRCMADYEADEQSRKEWMDRSKEAIDLALQVKGVKTFPWKDCANVKYPLLTIAALQFHARAYPSIIRGNQVVKGQVTGEDPSGEKSERAIRVGKHMSYQLLEEMDGWEEEFDQLLICEPILGCMFKKTYFDPNTKKNRSDLIFPQNFCVNNKCKTLTPLSRGTYLFTLYPQEIKERQMQGVYRDIEMAYGGGETTEEPQDMLEQHCLIDLDEDGYKEPYIVTIHKASGKLLRMTANYDVDTIWVKLNDSLLTLADIQESTGETGSALEQYKVARIAPVSYFTKFPFIPSPDGGMYSLGFGQLLLPLLETINSSINQMLDAGTRQNTGGGFVSKSLISDKKGVMTFAPGEYKQLENLSGASIRDAIYEFQHRGPSEVTFRLLDRLLGVCSDLTTVQDIMVGGAQDQETATTTLSRVEQGGKLFSAIHKRLYRSMKEEFKKLKRLNKFYLTPTQYFRVLDSGLVQKIGIADYQGDDTDVQPIADPTISSLALKLSKAQLLKQVATGNPWYSQREVEKRFLEAMEEPNIDAILLKEIPQPPPDPKLMEVVGKLDVMKQEVENMMIEKVKIASEAMLNIAKAEAEEAGNQFEEYRLKMEEMNSQLQHMREVMKIAMPTEQGGAGPVEARSPEQQGSPGAGGIPPELAAAISEGGVSQNGEPGGDGAFGGAAGGAM
jgi:chaperonin GroES